MAEEIEGAENGPAILKRDENALGPRLKGEVRQARKRGKAAFYDMTLDEAAATYLLLERRLFTIYFTYPGPGRGGEISRD